MASKAEKIVAGLGGIDNIEEVEGCITRLRTRRRLRGLRRLPAPGRRAAAGRAGGGARAGAR
ncbi:PTS transporter subunit EIIB, partial [Streptomyces roseolus]|uniref:PTS transporter subunit EIIB n=1 Tax=Streptomyces roseolus TaxID=67358 RepID=UPI0036504030